MDKIRCPNCRGMKQVAKLGGMKGDCNLCLGTGSINAEDKPKPVTIEPVEPAIDIIKQVASVASIKIDDKAVSEVLPEEPQIKVDPKKALYKRKKG